MATEKSDTASVQDLSKVTDDVTVIVGDVEQINDFEKTEYLVDSYAHDVGVKVLAFVHCSAFRILKLCAHRYYQPKTIPVSRLSPSGLYFWV
jgi:hypothetical protein